MVSDHVGVWLGSERCPPQLSAKTLLVNLIDQGAHIRVTVGEFAPDESPIAVGRLPAIIDSDPRETEFLHHGKSPENLRRCERAAITPRAPDWRKGGCGRRLELYALGLH